MKEVKFPPEIVDKEKMNYTLGLLGDLIVEHNAKAVDYRHGKITKAQWKDWMTNYYAPTQGAIINAIGEQKAIALANTFHGADLSKDIVDG